MILGGTGFIGRNLCEYLVKTGYQVSCLSRTQIDNPCVGTEYIYGDFFNKDLLMHVIEGKDYIIHAISTLNPGNSNEKYMEGYEKDFIQTIYLCKMLIGTKTKLIFLSSGGTVYGVHKHQPIDENVLPQPINHYGNVKLCIENALRAFNYQMHNKMLIVRISNPYGPGQDFTRGVGFIDAALKHAIKQEVIEIWGDGENIRDYIYINDVCQMIGSLLEYQGKFDTFNISSGVGVSQNEIIGMMRGIGLNPYVVYKEGRSVDIRRIVLDNHRIMSVCKYDLITLDKGLKAYYEYLVKNI